MRRLWLLIPLLLAHAALAQQGSYAYTGTDCQLARIEAQGVPRIGQPFVVGVTPDRSFVDGPISYLLTGFQPLLPPFDIGALSGHRPCGAPGVSFCGVLYSSIEIQIRAFGPAGETGLVAVPLSIPNAPQLMGGVFFQQNLVMSSPFVLRCVDLSRGGRAVIGT